MPNRTSRRSKNVTISSAAGAADVWWTIGQAMAWVGSRQPLDVHDWKEDTIPPRFAAAAAFGPPAFGASVSSAAAAFLIRQDDGVDEALRHIEAAIKQAAAGGRVALRGHRLRENGAPNLDARMEAIPADDFSIPSLAFYPASNSAGPGDEAADLSAVPCWGDLQVAANKMQEEFPAEDDVACWMQKWAEHFMRKTGRAPHKAKEAVLAAKKAGFSERSANTAYAKLPSYLKQAARKPKSAPAR